MISIIVCIKDRARAAKMENSLAETTNIAYEVISYVNDNNEGLCKVYNDCAAKARYPYLCFVHDDIVFHTMDWGSKIIQYLQDAATGIIGIAGGCYKSACGLDWKDGKESFYRASITDGLLNQSRFYFNPLNEKKSRVVCLDGLFLCCRKEIWEKNRFDEQRFTGFHFYDADWSMSVFQTLNNYVVYDIEIEHFSHGKINRSFLDDSLVFEKKWEHVLPANSIELDKKEIASTEGYVLTKKLSAMKAFGYSFSERSGLLKKYFYRYKNYYQVLRNLYYGFIKTKEDN
jgi:hypothetical protein